jgi:hypothetical protein
MLVLFIIAIIFVIVLLYVAIGRIVFEISPSKYYDDNVMLAGLWPIALPIILGLGLGRKVAKWLGV